MTDTDPRLTAAERGADDLIDLIEVNRRYEIEDALLARREKRRANRLRSLKGASTRRANFNAIDRFKGEMM